MYVEKLMIIQLQLKPVTKFQLYFLPTTISIRNHKIPFILMLFKLFNRIKPMKLINQLLKMRWKNIIKKKRKKKTPKILH